MNNGPHYFFTDATSLEVLSEGRPGVLLLGGYQGRSNFGDILQLKGVIRWHREHTRLEPLMVVNAYLLTGPDYLERLRGWFGTRALLLWSEEPLDAAAHGLQLVAEPLPVPYLHVYGGGFMNAYWGERMLRLIESLHATFGVGHYVLSGQQVQAEFAPRLHAHLRQYQPILAGGRDPASTERLAGSGAPAAYSFDDAIEIMAELAEPVAASAPEAEGLLVHLNASEYTVDRPGARDARLNRLARDLARLGEHAGRESGAGLPTVTLLNACTDARVGDINDTLSVVLELEERFPFGRYHVVDLARAALACGTGHGTDLVLARRARWGLSCSYHTAMFCHLAGVPTCLVTTNEYYRQKASGLQLPTSLDELRQSPAPRAFTEQRAARHDWLARLARAYAEPPNAARPAPRRDPPAAVRPWPVRHTYWTETQSLRAAYDQAQRHIAELAAARDKVWSDLEQMRAQLGEQADRLRARVRELETALAQAHAAAAAARTEAERAQRHCELRLAAVQAEHEYVREEAFRTRRHAEWLATRVADLERTWGNRVWGLGRRIFHRLRGRK